MAPDIIVYAIVAAGLVVWLRNILGTRHGDESQRPSPFMLPSEKVKHDSAPVYAKADMSGAEARIAELAKNPTKIFSVEGAAAERGLLEISRADSSFDVNFFLDGAQEAFAIIVEGFAKGERETLKDLLAEPVYKIFESAISEREKRGETMVTEILAIRKAEITDAGMTGRMANVTVRFRADETSVTKDAQGVVISGHPERVSEMKDLWTFGRDVRSRDPRWLVQATSGDEGDDVVPDAH